MDKLEIRAVMKYLFIKGMLCKDIYDNMLVTLWKDAPSYNVVKNSVAELKLGRRSIVDEHDPGHPKDAASTENMQILNDTLNEDSLTDVCLSDM